MREDELRSQLLHLERATAALEPDLAERQRWQEAADSLVNDFTFSLAQRRTFRPANPAQVAAFDLATSNQSDLPKLLSAVVEGMGESGLQAAGPGHLGVVPGGGLYAGAVADHVAAAINAFSADSFSAPIAVHVHEEVLRWLATVIGYGSEAWGDITSGGSHATLTAFYVARQAKGIRARDYHMSPVYLSEHTHHCCEKTLKILFGDDLCVRKVPQRDHVMDPAALKALLEADAAAGLRPWLLIATAGSTNLGRVDPLAELAVLAKEQGLWLHVDGAYGGMFSQCHSVKAKFSGIEEADSVVLDPHKGMFLPYGCGAVMFKNGEQLRASLSSTGTYLQDRSAAVQRSPMDYSFELTRPFRSLRLWLALKVHGAPMLVEALTEKLLLAKYCRDQLADITPLEMVGTLDLSIFAFRYAGIQEEDPDRATKNLLTAVNTAGNGFLSSTVVDGRFVIRVAILSFRTHLKTIDELVQTIKNEVNNITMQMQGRER